MKSTVVKRVLLAAATALCLAVAPLPGARLAHAANPPDTWDHLVRVKSKKLAAVYLLPGADFRTYSKIMLDPAQVAFRKNWVRDYNSSVRDLSRQISDEEAMKIADNMRTGALKMYSEVFQKAGYEIVAAPGADVLRIAPNIIDLYMTAPEPMTPGRSRTYTVDAGEATLALEVRDSLTGALLGRAVDRRTAGQGGTYLSRASDVQNLADFERLYRQWAEKSVSGLAELKERSPLVVNPGGKGPATLEKPAAQ